MKYLIFAAFLFVLLSQTSQAQEWQKLTALDVNQSEVIRALLDVVIGYVSQKGRFETTKTRFPAAGYSTWAPSIQYERRVTSTLTYYRYNFLLVEYNGHSNINATAVVSFDPSNYNFIVTSYSYKIANNGQNGPYSSGKTSLIDTRTLTGNGDLASLLRNSFNKIIAQKIQSGDLPRDTYTRGYIYHGVITQVDQAEETPGHENDETWPWPTDGWKDIYYLVKFKSSAGKNYLMNIKVHYVRNEETGEFGPEIFSLEGEIKWK